MAYTTKKTIIEKIRQGDEVAWSDFEYTYRSLIYLRGQDRSLTQEELPDLVQEVFLSLVKYESIIKYDNTKGRFRDYLKNIIDRSAFKMIRKRQSDHNKIQVVKNDMLDLHHAHDDMEKKWENQWRVITIEEALKKIRSEVNEATYEAFIMLMVDDVDAGLVADSLGISKESVYVAKHRVLKRLKHAVKQLEDM